MTSDEPTLGELEDNDMAGLKICGMHPLQQVRVKSWACDNFKASEEDPTFCANCCDFASMHKGPTPGAPRSFRL